MSMLAHASLLALLSVGLPFADAKPMPPDPFIILDGNHIVYLAEQPSHRTAAVVLCIIYGLMLGLAQGYRAGRMAGRKTGTSVSDVLVFVQGFLCTTFLFAVGINASGLGLSSDAQCYAAIRVCIAFYISTKTVLNLFLLERVYIVRAAFVKRTRDPIWMAGVCITLAGYGGAMGWEYIRPEARLSRDDGMCWIGVQSEAAAAFMALNTVTTVVLTGIFVWHLRRTVMSSVDGSPTHIYGTRRVEPEFSAFRRLFGRHNRSGEGSYRASMSRKNFQFMLIRNIIGSVILLVDTIVNKAIFLSWGWAKMGHACLLMCLTDIVLGMLITQWLTMRSAEDNARSAHHTFGPDTSSLTLNGRTSARSRRSTLDLWMPNIEAFTQDEKKPAPISNAIYERNDKAIHLDLR